MTTVTLRPNGTVFADPVTGAASAHAAWSDDSDSSYVTGGAEVNLGTVAMAGGVTKQARIRVRGRAVSGTERGFAEAVPSGPTLDAVFSTSVTTKTGAYAAVSWSQATVNGLRLRPGPFSGIPTNLRIMEAYLDLIYVAKPVVTVDAVSPDPWTASSLATVSWVNTLDADGGPQVWYEVKVYDEATYGAGFTGVDPDDDAPFYTISGWTSSTTRNVGPLPNDTYRAYVRIRQTVNGKAHYSAWDSDDFTVTLDTAEVDTVTAVPVDASAKVTVTVARDTGEHAWEYVEVQRSVDGGDWTDVRFATYVDATGDANTFVVDDYEVPNGVDVLYRARATWITSDIPVAGEWVESAAPVAWESDVIWLKSPSDPSLNRTVCPVNGSPVQEREVPSGVFQPIDARFPIVVSGTPTATRSELLVHVEGASDKASLLALLKDVQLLFQPGPEWMIGDDEGQIYLAVTGIPEAWRDPIKPQWRAFTVPYVEIAAPADPTAGR